jgi:hypothetical protein
MAGIARTYGSIHARIGDNQINRIQYKRKKFQFMGTVVEPDEKPTLLERRDRVNTRIYACRRCSSWLVLEAARGMYTSNSDTP